MATDEPESVFCPLDARVVPLWRIHNLILTGFFLATAVVGGGSLWAFSEAPKIIPAILILAACASVVLLAGWLPSRMYSAYRYRIDDVCLELRAGIVWRESVLIPISRVQHLDLQRGPLERRLGLATLRVHTAGTSHATHSIPGLDVEVALRLRERLAASANLVIQ